MLAFIGTGLYYGYIWIANFFSEGPCSGCEYPPGSGIIN